MEILKVKNLTKKYGKKGFTRQGTIKSSILQKESRSKSLKIRRMVNLAKNLKKLKK